LFYTRKKLYQLFDVYKDGMLGSRAGLQEVAAAVQQSCRLEHGLPSFYSSQKCKTFMLIYSSVNCKHKTSRRRTSTYTTDATPLLITYSVTTSNCHNLAYNYI